MNQNKLLNTNWEACRKNKIEVRDDDPVALYQNWHRQTFHMALTITGFIPTASGATIVIHQATISFCVRLVYAVTPCFCQSTKQLSRGI